MISKTSTTRIVGLPALVGMLVVPVQASTPDISRVTPETDIVLRSVELIYPQFAQVGGDDIGGNADNDSGSNDRVRIAPVGPAVEATTAQTTLIINMFRDNEEICEFMSDEYRVSCFAVTYRQMAQEIPANGDYAEAREVLLDTARKLDALVRSNLDRQKPALSARVRRDGGASVPTPPIRAVQAPRVAELNRQASNIVEEAETVLLRSASSDARRAIHYQRIAAAVGSNKVLLRSS